jgi:hypothetical protein
MTHWKALIPTADPPVPEDLLPDVIPALEKLEAAFRELEHSIPPDTPLWSGPEDES